MLGEIMFPSLREQRATALYKAQQTLETMPGGPGDPAFDVAADRVVTLTAAIDARDAYNQNQITSASRT